MTLVRFVDKYRNSTRLQDAKSVELVRAGGLHVDVKDAGMSLTVFAYEGRAVVATKVSNDMYRIVDMFQIDKSGRLTCDKLDLKKPENLEVAIVVSGMLRKTQTRDQNLSLGLFAVGILMCWLNSNWLRLISVVIETLIHLGLFTMSHYIKYLFAVMVPATMPVYVEPCLDTKALSNMFFFFWEIKFANYVIAYVCFKASGNSYSMETAAWASMGLLTIVWDVVIALCT